MMRYSELVAMQSKLTEFSKVIPTIIDGKFHTVEYSAQQIILNKDEPIHKVGILYAGKCRTVFDHETGNVFVLQNQEAVSFIGALACLGGGLLASAKFEAVTSCKVAYLKREVFEKWLELDPKFYQSLSRYYCGRFYNYFLYKGAELLYSSPSYRVLTYLLSSIRNQSIQILDENYIYKTREIISQEIGVPIKTLNRTLRGLIDDGAISIKRRKIMITKQQFLMSECYLEKYKNAFKNGKIPSPEAQQRVI